MRYFSKINKFSQNVLKSILTSSVLIIISGVLLLENYIGFDQLFIARKVIETGFCFLPLGIGLAFLTDYLYKKTVS